jgi:hypothetical protein
MRFLDRHGTEFSNGTKCLAAHNNGDGTSTIYFKTEEDLNALILDMKSSGITGKHTTRDYWQPVLLSECSYQVPDGCDAGSCSIGSCSLVDDPDYPHWPINLRRK